MALVSQVRVTLRDRLRRSPTRSPADRPLVVRTGLGHADLEAEVENLLPIGRFSKVCRLSVKALRYYDEVGLLRPALVDPSSGYRYYTYGQANRAEAIRVLRSLDMPVDEIREVLSAGGTAEAGERLAAHRARLQAELDRHTRMLAFLLRLIERGEGVMPYQVRLVRVPARWIAAVRMRTSLARIAGDLGGGYARIADGIGASGTRPAGPPFLIMKDVIDQETDGDVVLGVPVAGEFSPVGDVTCEREPDAMMACAVHRGPYDEVGPAYHTVQGWIQEHGHEVVGPPREVYLTDPLSTPDPADLVTEVQFPVG